MKKFCDERNIKLIFVSVRTPRGNGQMERYNRTIMPSLLKLSEDEPTKWHKYLGEVQLALNSTIQASTQKTPSQLLFGYNLNANRRDVIADGLLEEKQEHEYAAERDLARGDAEENVKKSQVANKRRYDRNRQPATEFKKDDYVMIQRVVPPTDRQPKMGSKFVGPYRIESVLNNDRYLVSDIPGHQVTQKPYSAVLPSERIKRWVQTNQETDSSPDDDTEDDVSSVWPNCTLDNKPTTNKASMNRRQTRSNSNRT